MIDKNIRLFHIIDDLKNKGYISDDKEIANKLGITKQSFSHLRNSVTKISLDLLESIKKIYPSINLTYIIMGTGEFYERESSCSEDRISTSKDQVIENLSNALNESSNTIAFLKSELQKERNKMGLLVGDVDSDTTADAQIG